MAHDILEQADGSTNMCLGSDVSHHKSVATTRESTIGDEHHLVAKATLPSLP